MEPSTGQRPENQIGAHTGQIAQKQIFQLFTNEPGLGFLDRG